MHELYLLAESFMDMGCYETAIGIFNRIIKDYASSNEIYKAYYNKGCCFSKLRLYNEAIECYDIALSQQFTTKPLANKAYALWALKNYSYALDVLECAICITPVENKYFEEICSFYDKAKRVYTKSQLLQSSQNEHSGVENAQVIIPSDNSTSDNQHQPLLGSIVDISMNINDNN